MPTRIEKVFFGKTSKDEDIFKFTLTNENKVSIGILDFGCVVHSICLPDKDGNVVDTNLGFDNVKDYEGNNNYFGALCGRVANRVAGGKLTIDGTAYQLSKNDPLRDGYVHGGFVGFSRRVWSSVVTDDKLVLSYVDADGSEGFPGEVTTHVTYTLDADNVLTMDYSATTTKTTVIDMGSHFMVNLAGHGAGPISDHVVKIAADKYQEMGSDFLPTGKLVSVEDDKEMDFRSPRSLGGGVLTTINNGDAFAHGYVLDKRGERKFMARVEHPASKRFMEVYSTNSTVFAYSNFLMERVVGDKPCKDGVVYQKYAAIEFMPMGYVDSSNVPSFPKSIVRPGETYHEVAWYKFGLMQ